MKKETVGLILECAGICGLVGIVIHDELVNYKLRKKIHKQEAENREQKLVNNLQALTIDLQQIHIDALKKRGKKKL